MHAPGGGRWLSTSTRITAGGPSRWTAGSRPSRTCASLRRRRGSTPPRRTPQRNSGSGVGEPLEIAVVVDVDRELDVHRLRPHEEPGGQSGGRLRTPIKGEHRPEADVGGAAL